MTQRNLDWRLGEHFQGCEVRLRGGFSEVVEGFTLCVWGMERESLCLWKTTGQGTYLPCAWVRTPGTPAGLAQAWTGKEWSCCQCSTRSWVYQGGMSATASVAAKTGWGKKAEKFKCSLEKSWAISAGTQQRECLQLLPCPLIVIPTSLQDGTLRVRGMGPGTSQSLQLSEPWLFALNSQSFGWIGHISLQVDPVKDRPGQV